MTPRERWEAVLSRQKPDRVPMGYSATREATDKLLAHLGLGDTDELFEQLHIDASVGAGGRYVGPTLPDGEDVLGLRYEQITYATGTYNECVHHPLAEYDTVAEIEAGYRWPDPDWWEYSHIEDDVRGKEHLPCHANNVSPFMLYGYLRGLEQSFIDFIENPEIARYCLKKLFDLAYVETQRIVEAIPGRVLYSFVADDFGSQRSLMMSREQILEYYVPMAKRHIDLLREAGVWVFHHNDGAIRPMIPDMIDAGIEVLNPVQWRCTGMDREGLKRDFGDRLVFHGGMDNQHTIAFGTVAEVRQEVVDNLATLGRGGGYIMAPCHNIQAVGPPENVVAMYETCYEERWT